MKGFCFFGRLTFGSACPCRTETLTFFKHEACHDGNEIQPVELKRLFLIARRCGLPEGSRFGKQMSPALGA